MNFIFFFLEKFLFYLVQADSWDAEEKSESKKEEKTHYNLSE